MRRSLLWTLLATVALSAVALFMPEHKPGQDLPATITATPSTLAQISQSPQTTAPLAPNGATRPNATPLPPSLPTPALEPAKRDIFALATPPAPPHPPAPVVVAPIYQAPVASPPPAPPMAYRYWGRMTTPEGQQISYLVKGGNFGGNVGDNLLPITPGTALDDGWQVESVGEDNVALVYPALKQRVVIPIAPAQIQ